MNSGTVGSAFPHSSDNALDALLHFGGEPLGVVNRRTFLAQLGYDGALDFKGRQGDFESLDLMGRQILENRTY